MPLHKTERARVALHDRSGGLSAFERRILILSDGRRTTDALVSLLGTEARPGVERLLAAGFLAMAAPSAVGVRRDHVSVVAGPLPVDPVPATPAGPPASHAMDGGPGAAPHATRRSLAASKMYVIDMLQLQRDPRAGALVAAIRGNADPQRLAESLLQALAFLQRSAPTSYSRRVLDRVAEILPEDVVPALDAQRDAITAAA